MAVSSHTGRAARRRPGRAVGSLVGAIPASGAAALLLAITGAAWTAQRRPAVAGGLALLAVVGIAALGAAVLSRQPGLVLAAAAALGGQYCLAEVGHPIEIGVSALYAALLLGVLELTWAAIDSSGRPVGSRRPALAGTGRRLLVLVPAALAVSLVVGLLALGGRGAGSATFVIGLAAAVGLVGLVVAVAAE